MVQSKISGSSQFVGVSRKIIPLTSFVIALILWSAICIISRQPGEMALHSFLLFSAGIMLCSIAALWHYHCQNRRIAFRWIFLSALILRLVSLIGEPLFEDDHFRYMWDGYQTATTNDPYTLAPDAFFDEDVPEAFEPILSFINYPDVANREYPLHNGAINRGYVGVVNKG